LTCHVVTGYAPAMTNESRTTSANAKRQQRSREGVATKLALIEARTAALPEIEARLKALTDLLQVTFEPREQRPR
jgi:hypothetical protein